MTTHAQKTLIALLESIQPAHYLEATIDLFLATEKLLQQGEATTREALGLLEYRTNTFLEFIHPKHDKDIAALLTLSAALEARGREMKSTQLRAGQQ